MNDQDKNDLIKLRLKNENEKIGGLAPCPKCESINLIVGPSMPTIKDPQQWKATIECCECGHSLTAYARIGIDPSPLDQVIEMWNERGDVK